MHPHNQPSQAHIPPQEDTVAAHAAVAAAVRELGPGWVHIDEVTATASALGVGQVVVGPGGIYVIEAKPWAGTITIKANGLHHDGHRHDQDVAACAEAALTIAEHLPAYVDHIYPVMCCVRDEPISGQVHEVQVCATANLAELLTQAPAVLSPTQIDAAATRLRQTGNPAGPGDRHPGAATAGHSRPDADLVKGAQPDHIYPRPSNDWHPSGQPRPRDHPGTGDAELARPRMMRLLVGLGLWLMAMSVLGMVTAFLPASRSSVLGWPPFALALLAWLLARRIIRDG